MIKFIQEIRGKNPKEKRSLTLKSIYALLFCLVWGIGGVKGQIYQHNFGATDILTKPYTGAPSTFAANLSNSSWTTSAAGWSGLTGSSGESLSLNNSSGTPTYTLTFDVAAGFQVEITHFNFWRVRSTTGAQNWAMTINGTSVGSGTVPTAGAALGSTAVSSARSGLTGSITIVLTMSGASGTGTFRLDDFTLTGSVTSTATPAITLNDNSQITSGNINQGATNQILSQFSAVVTDADATLNSLTFNAGGSFIAGDLTNFKLYTNTTNTFPGGSALSTVSAGSIANSNAVTFSGLSQANVIGTRYYWITTDVAGSGTSSNTVNVPSLSNSNFTFASGTVSGTITAGGSQTIQAVTPDISISSNHPISGSINQNSTNQVIGSISLAITNTNATLSALTVTTAGSYNTSDLVASSFKLYYTSSNSFSTSTQLGSAQAIVASGNTITFSGLSQTINNGSTGYLWVTCDVAYNAVSANTISLTTTAFSNINFVSGNLTGTNPVAASNNMTIATVTPSIAIAFIGPSASVADIPTTSLILNQFSMATTLNSADLNSITATLGGTYTTADLTSNSFKLWYNTFNTFGTATQIGSSQAIVSSGNSITFSSLAQKLNIGSTAYFWITVDVSGSATNGNTIFVDANAFTNIALTNATKTGIDPISAGGTKTLTTQVTPGSVVINQFSADYGGASDEFIELANLTSQAIDLSSLKLNYLSASGGGTYSSALTGTIPANGFWLLSPNATVTVGLTSLSRDGSFTAGFSTAGQIAIRRNSDNTIIDGLAFGTVTSNSFGEGSSAAAAPTDGAIKRVTDGADAGANSTDFTTVTNASIYLRNSGSRLGRTGSSIAAGTYRDLTITGNTSLSGAVNITNKVEVLSGTLTTDGNLTLKSDASGTASIGNSAGTISGNITVERYIPGGASRRRTRFLASPVVGGTALQWRNNGTNATGLGIQITGNGGASNSFDVSNNTNNPASAWTYTQGATVSSSGSNGSDWTGFTTGSMSLTNGQGYRVLVRGDRMTNLSPTPGDPINTTSTNTTISVSGTYPGSSVVVSTTRNETFSNGWNLVGNPYPSPINWSAVTKGSDVDASYWVYNPSSGTYVSHNGTSGTATNLIASGQGFFVRRNTGTTGSLGDITFSEASKTTGNGHFLGKSQIQEFEYIMKYDSNNYDGNLVVFDANYSDADDNFDTDKLSNASINICTKNANGRRLSINSLKPIENEEKVIPIDVSYSVLAKYTLEFARMESLNNLEVLLKDKYLNKTVIVTPELKYAFELTSDSNSTGENRFEFIFRKSATGLNAELSSSNNFIVFPNPANNVLNLSLTTTKEDNYNFTIYNQLGAEVNAGNLDFNAKRTHALNIENLSNGVYFIQVKNGKTAQTIKFIK
jgi:hypothetical protein